ncbi:uncharacterized protein LOC106177473 isoform X2 [Lingula anatina]|nr:uncharacterized protein LOC106177473 isoform X2 [Lingula anatina]|eukprot:XP_013415709.1 uncharacterized protein LOC106177473 isoform X2 [Lingula anatina]
MDPRNIKCRQSLKQKRMQEEKDNGAEEDEDSENDMEIVMIRESPLDRSGRLSRRGKAIDRKKLVDQELQACGIDADNLEEDEKEEMIKALRMSKQQAAKEEKYREHVRDQKMKVVSHLNANISVQESQSLEEGGEKDSKQCKSTESAQKQEQTLGARRSNRKIMQVSQIQVSGSKQKDDVEEEDIVMEKIVPTRTVSRLSKKIIAKEMNISASTAIKQTQGNTPTSQEKLEKDDVDDGDDDDDATQPMDLEDLSPDLFSTQQDDHQIGGEIKSVPESDEETLSPSLSPRGTVENVNTSETQEYNSQECPKEDGDTKAQPRKRKSNDSDQQKAAKISRGEEAFSFRPNSAEVSSGTYSPSESQETPTPSPVTVKLVNRKSLKRKLLYKGPSYFAPVGVDPLTYTKVIVQLFDQYRVLLRESQHNLTEQLSWGKPVEVGRHMENTVGLYKRGGEKNLNFGLEEEKDVQDVEDETEVEEPQKVQKLRSINSNVQVDSSQLKQTSRLRGRQNEPSSTATSSSKWTYDEKYVFPDETSGDMDSEYRFKSLGRKSRKPKIRIDAEEDLPELITDDSTQGFQSNSSSQDNPVPPTDISHEDNMYRQLGFEDFENSNDIPVTVQEEGRTISKKCISQKNENNTSLRLSRSKLSTRKTKIELIEETVPESLIEVENSNIAKKPKLRETEKSVDTMTYVQPGETLDVDDDYDENYDDYFAGAKQLVVTSTQKSEQIGSDSPIFSGDSRDFSLGVSNSKQFSALFDSFNENDVDAGITRRRTSALKSEDLDVPLARRTAKNVSKNEIKEDEKLMEEKSLLKQQCKGETSGENDVKVKGDKTKYKPKSRDFHSQDDRQLSQDDKREVSEDQDRTFQCPVCGVYFPKTRIEEHVDRCLDGASEDTEEDRGVHVVSEQLRVKPVVKTFERKTVDNPPTRSNNVEQDFICQDSGSESDWADGKEAKIMIKDDLSSSDDSIDARAIKSRKNKKKGDQFSERKTQKREPTQACIICNAKVPQSKFEEHVGLCLDEQERGQQVQPEPRVTRQASPRLAQQRKKRHQEVKGEEGIGHSGQSTGQWLSTDKNDSDDFVETKSLSSVKKRQS